MRPKKEHYYSLLARTCEHIPTTCSAVIFTWRNPVHSVENGLRDWENCMDTLCFTQHVHFVQYVHVHLCRSTCTVRACTCTHHTMYHILSVALFFCACHRCLSLPPLWKRHGPGEAAHLGPSPWHPVLMPTVKPKNPNKSLEWRMIYFLSTRTKPVNARINQVRVGLVHRAT